MSNAVLIQDDISERRLVLPPEQISPTQFAQKCAENLLTRCKKNQSSADCFDVFYVRDHLKKIFLIENKSTIKNKEPTLGNIATPKPKLQIVRKLPNPPHYKYTDQNRGDLATYTLRRFLTSGARYRDRFTFD